MTPEFNHSELFKAITQSGKAIAELNKALAAMQETLNATADIFKGASEKMETITQLIPKEIEPRQQHLLAFVSYLHTGAVLSYDAPTNLFSHLLETANLVNLVENGELLFEVALLHHAVERQVLTDSGALSRILQQWYNREAADSITACVYAFTAADMMGFARFDQWQIYTANIHTLKVADLISTSRIYFETKPEYCGSYWHKVQHFLGFLVKADVSLEKELRNLLDKYKHLANPTQPTL